MFSRYSLLQKRLNVDMNFETMEFCFVSPVKIPPVGTGVPDGPQREPSVGTGVPDGPFCVPDGPQREPSVGTGVPDGPFSVPDGPPTISLGFFTLNMR